MRLLYVRNGEEPEVIDVPHRLDALQALVGGRIEVVEPFVDEAILVCNEEGRNWGLPVNRVINERMDICGNFFICGHNEDGLCSIPESLIPKYTSIFQFGSTMPVN